MIYGKVSIVPGPKLAEMKKNSYLSNLKVTIVRKMNQTICRQWCTTNNTGHSKISILPLDALAEKIGTAIPPSHIFWFTFTNTSNGVESIRACMQIEDSCLTWNEVLNERQQ